MNYQKKAAKRAFSGLAGSFLGLSQRVKQALRDRPDLIPHVTKERSITELLARGKDGVKVSSKDLDPAFEPAKAVEISGRGTGPAIYEDHNPDSMGSGDPDSGDDTSTINAICQAMGSDGFAVQKLRGGPRESTPEWVWTSLEKFIIGRVGLDKPGRSDKHNTKIPLRAVIDYWILFQYFLEDYTDEEIFRNLLDMLRRDLKGTRWCSSVEALKKRRERLVDAGNKLFGVRKDPDEDELAPPEAPRLRRLDAGPGEYRRNCAVSGCENQAAASKPITGIYVCSGHPRKVYREIQKKSRRSLELRGFRTTPETISSPILPYVEGENSPDIKNPKPSQEWLGSIFGPKSNGRNLLKSKGTA